MRHFLTQKVCSNMLNTFARGDVCSEFHCPETRRTCQGHLQRGSLLFFCFDHKSKREGWIGKRSISQIAGHLVQIWNVTSPNLFWFNLSWKYDSIDYFLREIVQLLYFHRLSYQTILRVHSFLHSCFLSSFLLLCSGDWVLQRDFQSGQDSTQSAK